ncbi:hypothetical protein SAMN02910358_00645 [Lachnospiraceae bacterium XBB1006]|nr:hypothetical protein SAMN02910358_00645 [Lachnospiraceae bacterium XBB1006]
MKTKRMTRSDWKRVYRKRFYMENYEHSGKNGKISLFTIEDLRAPLLVCYQEKWITVADVNYSWLQIAFEGEYFWLTAMFDEKNCLKEIYVDMTDGNNLETEDPYFRDMYLDYVIMGDSDEVIELDRDELEEAYDYGEITKEQYIRTLMEGERLLGFLTAHGEDVKELVKREQRRLKRCSLSDLGRSI